MRQLHERVAVPGLAHHVEPRALEQAGQPLAQQDVVVGDEDPVAGHT